MKHNKLHSIAHNFADSIAGGVSFVVPNTVVHTDVFEELAASENGIVVADILSGRVEHSARVGVLEQVLPVFRDAFPEFCQKHGANRSDFEAFLVRFISTDFGIKFVVTVQGCDGRRSSREYSGNPGKRIEICDALGRRRTKILRTPAD